MNHHCPFPPCSRMNPLFISSVKSFPKLGGPRNIGKTKSGNYQFHFMHYINKYTKELNFLIIYGFFSGRTKLFASNKKEMILHFSSQTFPPISLSLNPQLLAVYYFILYILVHVYCASECTFLGGVHAFWQIFF